MGVFCASHILLLNLRISIPIASITHSKPRKTGTQAHRSQNTKPTHSHRKHKTLQAAQDRNGCWPQPSVFDCTACAALGTSPSFDAQPTLLSFIAHQRNFGSRQTHGEKHRNPARGQRNFWLLFLPWKSNKVKFSYGKTPKTPPPQAIIYAPYSNTTSDQNAASHQQAAAAPSPAAQHHHPTPQQPQLPVRLSQR